MSIRTRMARGGQWGLTSAALIVLVVWVGGVWAHIQWASRSGVLLATGQGLLTIARWTPGGPISVPPGWGIETRSPEFYLWYKRTAVPGFSHLAVPLWPAAAVLGMGAFVVWRGDMKTRRRARAGCCVKCGYDRAGLMGETVCPECGATAA